jgi:hypothetical protein
MRATRRVRAVKLGIPPQEYLAVKDGIAEDAEV